MTFQVYYRKWRPQSFRELVGQEHVSTTLREAVKQGRVAHSYLFCGPRGTGKTSSARVLAKAINCHGPVDGDPCNTCPPCQSINEGRFMDLIELDAASNGGKEEIQNIRDKVNLSPTAGGRKVYIIDEAHMLTDHASNAFLKTLEEPPAHAIFILCTTDPHKILATIISRCQRFDFRRLSSEIIKERLSGICVEERVDIDSEALTALARSSGGSLRDAENLLEQLVTSTDHAIGLPDVTDMLGIGPGKQALEFVQYLLTGNASGALSTINQAAWEGSDVGQLHRQAVELVRAVLMIQHNAREALDLAPDTTAELDALAPKTTPALVLKALKLLGEATTRHHVSPSLPLELATVEVCMAGLEEERTPLPRQPARVEPQPRPRVATPQPTAPVPIRRTPEASAEPPNGVLGEPERPASPSLTPALVDRAEPSEGVPGGPKRTEAPSLAPVSHAEPSEGVSLEPERPPAPSPAPVSQAEPATGDVQATEPQPQDGKSEPDAPPEARGIGSGQSEDWWPALVKTLSRSKGKLYNIGALLRGCNSQLIEGDSLVLSFAHRSNLERLQEELDNPQGQKAVEDAVLKVLGASYRMRLTQSVDERAGAGTPSAQSPLIRAAMSMGARIVEERDQS